MFSFFQDCRDESRRGKAPRYWQSHLGWQVWPLSKDLNCNSFPIW